MSLKNASKSAFAVLMVTSMVSGPLAVFAADDSDPTRMKKPVSEMDSDEIVEQAYTLSTLSRDDFSAAYMRASAKLSETTALSPSERSQMIDKAYTDISNTITQIEDWKHVGTTGTFVLISTGTLAVASLAGPAMLRLNAAGVGLVEKAVPNSVGGPEGVVIKLPLLGERINAYLTTAANVSKDSANFALKWTNYGLDLGQRILRGLGRSLTKVTVVGSAVGGSSGLLLYYFESSAVDKMVPVLRESLVQLEKMKAAEAYINGQKQ